jgi:transposase InsO family protein
MRASTYALAVGSRVNLDGETWSVVELHADRVALRDRRGRTTVIVLDELVVRGVWAAAPAASTDRDALGALLGQLDDELRADVLRRAEHLREVDTGYRHGSAELRLPGEPRFPYKQDVPLMERYAAKATELGITIRTLRRWSQTFRQVGPAGLIDARRVRPRSILRRLDPRWLDAIRAITAEYVNTSTPTKRIVIDRAKARVRAEYGDEVPIPSQAVAYKALVELSRGRNSFSGNARWRRTIATRPPGTYGRLRATRPGEYVFIDTTPLDVYAMDQITLRWHRVEITVALDLFTRCVLGLRLSPLSTRSTDIAKVLYDAIRPKQRPEAWPVSARWPYHGIPWTIVLDADRIDTRRSGPPPLSHTPTVLPETLVVDHGKIYVSDHVESVCARFGISIQPVRPYTPTDKAPLERFFRTLRQGLLEALPGYKGPDVYSRGKDVEDGAYFFIHELEEIIRGWIATVYHVRPHDGLAIPEVPGLAVSPYEMYGEGISRAGYLHLPERPDLVYDFLPVEWRTIQHYGVEIHGLRYNGPGIDRYRDTTSPYPGQYVGKWPFRVDPDNLLQIYFQDPADRMWHELAWEHLAEIGRPFSTDALKYARRLALKTHRFPDDRQALTELLTRFGLPHALTPEERRIALRLSRQDRTLLAKDAAQPDRTAAARMTDATLDGRHVDRKDQAGADDSDDELEAMASDEVSCGEYYRSALEDAE